MLRLPVPFSGTAHVTTDNGGHASDAGAAFGTDRTSSGVMKSSVKTLLSLAFVLIGPLLVLATGSVRLGQDWRTADRSSAGIAPAASEVSEAIVSVWAARAFNWRGVFAVHTWIATKPENATHYTVHQVLGWRGWNGGRVVVSSPDLPDRSWYGHPARLVEELRGPEAAAAIPKILKVIDEYPYARLYRMWPGPNSNTFTAHVARRVPELRVELPSIAVGKDFLVHEESIHRERGFDWAPGGPGFQISVLGIGGVLVGVREGIEFNLLGLVFGLDPLGPAIKLPGIGRIGFGGPSGM